jgi:cyclic pyranopterin phosphate synthase
MNPPLTDGHGRRFEYLRLSLTDVCNFPLHLLLPKGYRKQAGQPASLTVAETGRLIAAFARLGLWKVRLTGGEPSLRRKLLDIARTWPPHGASASWP